MKEENKEQFRADLVGITDADTFSIVVRILDNLIGFNLIEYDLENAELYKKRRGIK